MLVWKIVADKECVDTGNGVNWVTFLREMVILYGKWGNWVTFLRKIVMHTKMSFFSVDENLTKLDQIYASIIPVTIFPPFVHYICILDFVLY